MSENARPRKLPKKYENAIAALLGCPTLEAAAILLRIDVSTLRRWMKDEAFQEAYRDARKRLMESTITRLQQVSEKAVATLEKNMACGQPATEVRAAVAVLEYAGKGYEQLNMENRIAALEEAAEQRVRADDQR